MILNNKLLKQKIKIREKKRIVKWIYDPAKQNKNNKC